MEPTARPTMMPTKTRHIEAAAATVLWIAFLPLTFFVGSDPLNCIMIILVIGLMIHAYTMRPYCTEFDEEEEEAMMEMVMSTEPKLASNWPDLQTKETAEEWKLVGLVIALLCTVGSGIAFGNGGAEVFHTWRAPMATDCSVAELADLQGKYQRFGCHDGFVDLGQQRSLMVKGGSLVKTYDMYRIAPVYTDQSPRSADLPIAWAVSKNLKLTKAPCGETGLCGIFTKNEDADKKDLENYKQLMKVAREAVVKAGASEKFDEDSIPSVILTSLVDPEGKTVYFYTGVIFYVVVLVGLLHTQRSMLIETPSKLDSERIFGGSTPPGGYDQLDERISTVSNAME